MAVTIERLKEVLLEKVRAMTPEEKAELRKSIEKHLHSGKRAPQG
jgi:hypothetical protein